jgi:TonB-linked SusC/RagA family outer membrane protein
LCILINITIYFLIVLLRSKMGKNDCIILKTKTSQMKSMYLLLFALLIYSGSTFAQKIEVKGKVVDQSTGEPLGGVSIITNKNKGALLTKPDGTFALSLANGASTLVFTFVGYVPQSVTASNNSMLNILMVPKTLTQEEVVVIGYGTQKKSSLTGAVAKYKNDRMDESPLSRLDQALQGRIAGLTVQNISSEAGAAPKINIRGISSINAGSSPLVVVDGQPIPDGLAFLNMADVESVEVLKDAASAAIYGSRGSGGVIIVTTKKGTADKPKYVLKYSVGQKKDYKRYDIMTTGEYIGLLFQEMAKRAQDTTVLPANNIVADGDRASYVVENLLRGGQSTDWQSESLRPATFQNVMLSVAGGKKDVRYFLSTGYQNDEGMMYKSNYEKFNIRTRVDLDLSKKVKLSLNVNPSYSKRSAPSENFTNFWRFPTWLPIYHNEATAAFVNTNPQYAGIRAGDYAHPRHFSGLSYSGPMPDGTNWTSGATTVNPSGSAQQNPKSAVIRTDIFNNEYRLQSSADLNIVLLPGLTFKTLASTYLNYNNGLDFSQRSANRDGDNNRGVFTNNVFIDLLSENTLNYVKSIGKSDLNILAGFTSQKTTVSKDQTAAIDFPSDNIRTLNSAAQLDKLGTFGTKNQIGLLSYLGRLNYAYDDKYLLSASFRADGSSYFGPGNKWGTFPSISLGWVASKEKFLSNIDWLSNLKFRGSYGVSGNNRITDFAFLDLMYGANYSLGSGTGTSSPGLVNSPTIISNPAITWESTYQSNFGMDLTLFSGKLGITLDAYKSKTDKLLLQQSAMAFTGVPQFWNNIGSLRNTGIEIEVTTRNIQTKSFKWSTSGNISQNRNSIIELGTEAYLLNQGERTEVYRNKVGNPLVQYFGFKTDGVWISQEQINKAIAGGLTSSLSNVFVPGGLKIVDVNGDNKIDNEDRTDLGNPYPDFTWGITNNFSYKGFDASFSFQGVKGGKLINGDPNYNESRRTIKTYNQNRWVSAKFPGDGKTPFSTLGYNWMLTDYVIEDASYFSLRDVNIGYTIPADFMKKLKVNSLRFYLSAQNLYFKTAKGYRGLNPEGRFTNGSYSSVLIDGYQRGSFPIPKTVLLGIDINF